MKIGIKILYLIFFLRITDLFAQHPERGPLPVPMHPPPVPEFSVSDFCYGDSTHFINQTIHNFKPNWYITTANWHFADTIYTSPDKDKDTNITYKFPHPGSYTVTLTQDNGHYVWITKVLQVDSPSVTRADFSFQQCTMQFVNMSSCSSNFSWDFGDGSFSFQQFPVHQYADTGSYSVRLISSNGIQSDTMVKTIHVDLKGFPIADFSTRQSYDTVFFSTSDVLADYYVWSFGDNSFAGGKDTMHVYKDTGDFIISCSAVNNCGIASKAGSIHLLFPDLALLDTSVLSVLIYPNPVASSSSLNYTVYFPAVSDASLAVYSVLGAKIIEQPKHFEKGINSGTLAITSLPPGMYTLLLKEGGKNKILRKFVVRNQ